LWPLLFLHKLKLPPLHKTQQLPKQKLKHLHAANLQSINLAPVQLQLLLRLLQLAPKPKRNLAAKKVKLKQLVAASLAQQQPLVAVKKQKERKTKFISLNLKSLGGVCCQDFFIFSH
jgi:hypothetical protein